MDDDNCDILNTKSFKYKTKVTRKTPERPLQPDEGDADQPAQM